MPLDNVQLESINSISVPGEKIKAFIDLVTPLVGVKQNKAPDVKSVQKFSTFIINQVGENDSGVSKPVLQNLVSQLEQVSEDYNEELLQIIKQLVDLVRPKYSYFCESLIKLLNIQVELFQADENWRECARALTTIDTDDQYVISTMDLAERIEWKIRTAEFFLAYQENTNATIHIQKSKKLLRDLPLAHPKRQVLDLRNKTCYSRILDSERKFLLAAVNYMELSQISSGLVQEQDLLESLKNAVTCAILGKAGPSRSRILAMLYRDERSRTLSNFKVLEKMHKNRILSQKEQDEFSKTLSEHHQAEVSGGLTVTKKAMYEHNMLAASQLYKNIRLEELGKLLGISALQAEDLARVMIQESRLKGTIDQVDNIIEFEEDQSILLSWDIHIQDLCMSINDVVDQIDLNYPGKFNIP